MKLRKLQSRRTSRPNPATYVLHADGTVTVLYVGPYGPQLINARPDIIDEGV